MNRLKAFAEADGKRSAEVDVADAASDEADQDGHTQNGDAAEAEQPAPATPSPSVPRSGSKLALILGLLRREAGACLDELVAATGWLPHTTRAALTGLRQNGHALKRAKDEGRTVYRIAKIAAESLDGGVQAAAEVACRSAPSR